MEASTDAALCGVIEAVCEAPKLGGPEGEERPEAEAPTEGSLGRVTEVECEAPELGNPEGVLKELSREERVIKWDMSLERVPDTEGVFEGEPEEVAGWEWVAVVEREGEREGEEDREAGGEAVVARDGEAGGVWEG